MTRKHLSRRTRALLALVSLLFVAACNEDQVTFTADTQPQLQVVAGALGGRGFADGGPDAARMTFPRRMAIDAQSGNMFINDDCTFRKIGSDGRMTTLGQPDAVACTGGSQVLPRAMVARPGGGFYYTSAFGPQIIQVDDAGASSTYYDFADHGSLAAIAVASDGAVFVLRDVVSTCEIDRIAVVAGVPGLTALVSGPCGSADGGPGTGQVPYQSLSRMRFDSVGNLYLATTDASGGTLRKIAPDGAVSTLVTGAGAGLHGIAIDAQDNIFVLGWGTSSQTWSGSGNDVNDTQGCLVWKVLSGGTLQLIAGQDSVGGPIDGTGAAARIPLSIDLAIDAAGNLWVPEETASTLARITPAGVVTRAWGSTAQFGHVDAAAGAARFNAIFGLVTDPAGNVFVADSGNCVVRKIDLRGNVTTVAGVAGNCAAVVDGPAGTATFAAPTSLAVDSAGALYVADACVVRKVAADGSIATLAGNAALCIDVDGSGANAGFGQMVGLAVDATGNVFVSEGSAAFSPPLPECGFDQCALGGIVRKITPGGVVTTLAGTPGASGAADGQGAAASFGAAQGMAVDGQGNVYVADTVNHAIRKITPTGLVSTLAGSASQAGAADGTGAAARFIAPSLLVLARDGSLVVLDNGTYFGSSAIGAPTLRRVAADGVVTTLLTSAGFPDYGVIPGTAPRLDSDSYGLAIDSTDGILLATENAVVRFGVPQ